MKAAALSMIATGWLLLAPASLPAAEPSVCETCVDGPEMFQHVKPKNDVQDSIQSIKAEPIGCDVGPVVRTYGKADWLVTECDDGTLKFSPTATNRAPETFTFSTGGFVNPFVGERPRNRRARAAYDEVKSLTTEQLAALIQDVRKP
jgi:hypothetical protein